MGEARCVKVAANGSRCRLLRQPYGDGTLCGLHYHAAQRASQRAPRLLLVEDHDRGDTLRAPLRELGFDVTAAASVSPGLEALRRRDYTLVLLHEAAGWSAVDSLVQAAAPAPAGLVSRLEIDKREWRARGLAFFVREPASALTLRELVAPLAGRRLSPGEAARIRAYFAALFAADWERLGALCTHRVEYRLQHAPSGAATTIRGRSACREFAEATLRRFPDVRFAVAALLPLQRGAIARCRVAWRGGQHPVHGAALFRLEKGLIARVDLRLDVG